MRWFASDFHFFHKHVINYNSRPFSSIEEMHEKIIKSLNAKVNKKDVLYILGDFSFGNFEQTSKLVQRINGKKRLIRGNHDYRFSAKNFIDMGFEDVRDYDLVKINSTELLMCHYPYHKPLRAFWFNKILKRTYKKYYDFYPRNLGRWLIHGHFHEDEKIKPKHKEINVTLDVNKFNPVSENEIWDILNKYR